MSKLNTRIATQNDMDRVLALYSAVIADVSGKPWDVCWKMGFRPDYADLDEAVEKQEMILGELEGEEQLAAVVVINSKVVEGYEQVDWLIDVAPEEVMSIHLFCVNPAFSGQGVGVEFLEQLGEISRQRGAKTFRLDVLVNNTPAQRLFIKAGFINHGFYNLNYGENHQTDFLLMDKVL